MKRMLAVWALGAVASGAVVAATAADCAETFPAASTAATV